MENLAKDAVAKIRTDIKNTANKDARVEYLNVEWQACRVVGTQPQATAAQIKDLTAEDGPWDVIMYGYSRGGIYLNEVAAQIKNDADLNSQIDYLTTVLLDPTAARLLGDNYPTVKSSVVDYQIHYDDGHKIAQDTGVVVSGSAAAGCAVDAVASGAVTGLGGAASGCIIGAVTGGVIGGVTDALGKAWGYDVSDVVATDGLMISGTVYRNIHDELHKEYDLGAKDVDHSLRSHSQVPAWYNDSAYFTRDLARFLGYKDLSLSVVTLRNNTDVEVPIQYRWRDDLDWHEFTIKPKSTHVVYQRVFDRSVEFKHPKFVGSSATTIKTLWGARHYGTLDPTAADGTQYIVSLSADEITIERDLLQPDVIGLPDRSSISNNRPAGDQSIMIETVVRNIGTAKSGSGRVAFTTEGFALNSPLYVIGQGSFGSLSPGQQAVVRWTGIVPKDIPLGNYLVNWEIELFGDESKTVNNTDRVRAADGISYAALSLLDASPTADEPNDTLATATFVTDGARAVGLHSPARAKGELQGSIHQAGDADWYQIDMLSWSGEGSSAWIESPEDINKFTLELFDEDQQRIDIGTHTSIRVRISLASYPRASYYLRVTSSAQEANYRLRYDLQPRAYATDGQEPNDTTSQATRIEQTSLVDGLAMLGSIERPGDVDWYRIELHDWASLGSYVKLSGIPLHGDLGVWLNSADGQIRLAPALTTIDSLREWKLDLSYLPPGVYYIGVAAHWTIGDTLTYDSYYDVGVYLLEMQVGALGLHRDRYEPNDVRTAATPSIGDFIYSLPSNWRLYGIPDRTQQPTLDSPSDTDWYRFSMPGHGQPADVIQLKGQGTTGIRVRLFDAEGAFLATGQTLPDGGRLIPMDGRLPGVYFVQVDSLPGVQAPYDLYIDAVGMVDDALEPNDNVADATLLTAPLGSIETLSIPTVTDEDWYQFTLGSVGQNANVVWLDYQRNRPGVRVDGVLRMELRDGDGRLIASDVDDELSLQGLPAGTYTVRVSGRARATNTYDLHYDLLTDLRLPAIVQDDGFPITRLSFSPEGDAVPLADGTLVGWLSTRLGGDALMYIDLSQPDPRPRRLDVNGGVGSFHIADGWIVWSEYDGNDFEIFAFDGNITRQLTDNAADDLAPRVSRGQVVWEGPSSGVVRNWEIFSWLGGTTTQLTFNSWDDELPQVQEGFVAWMGRAGGNNSDYEIFILNGDTPQQITFNDVNDRLGDTTCTGAFSGCRPIKQVDPGRVVWHSGEANEYQTVYLFDGADVVPVFEGLFVFPPVIDGDLIAFQALGGDDLFRVTDFNGDHLFWGGEGSTYQVFAYEHYNGRSLRQLTVGTEPGDLAESPWIDGGRVFWQESINGAPAEIYVYDGQTSRQLTDNSFYEYQFMVNQGRIVWSDGNADPNGDVFLLEVAPKRLTVDIPAANVPENSPSFLFSVTRHHADAHNPLVVQISTFPANQLSVPSTVVIPAGQMSTLVFATPLDNLVLDGDRDVAIIARSEGFQFGDDTVRVLDHESLSLVLDATTRSFSESIGSGLAILVSRSAETAASAVQVNLTSNDPSVTVPESITLSAGETSTSIPVTIHSDLVLRTERMVSITASASGFVSDEEQWRLLDDERLHLTTSQLQVIEGGAFTLTIRRDAADMPLEVTLFSGDEAIRFSPTLVAFGLGETEVSVVGTVTDDAFVEGPRIRSMWAAADGYETGEANITIEDNDTAQVIWANEPVTARELAAGTQVFVSLASRPTDAIRIELAAPIEIAFEPSFLIVTPDRWNEPQLVSVRLVQGNLLPGGVTSLQTNVSISTGDVQFASTLPTSLVVQATNATPMQNPFDPFDVNGDNRVSPIDVLVIISFLNQLGNPNPLPTNLLDVSGDNRISPIDVLLIINELNRGQANGEAPPSASLGRSVFWPVTFEVDATREQDAMFAEAESFVDPSNVDALSSTPVQTYAPQREPVVKRTGRAVCEWDFDDEIEPDDCDVVSYVFSLLGNDASRD